jgi:expansin (peptidoglycan-binding protein)
VRQPVRQAAAPPTGGTVHTGKATFYDSKGAGGNCSLPAAPADRLYVALGPSEYSSGAACGGHLDVTGPRGKVRVLVMDQCPECPPGHLDLSKEAFARIGDPARGVVPVSYRAVVDPPLSGPLAFRMKDGSSQWWFAVQVGNHGNPLRSVEARPASGGSWRSAARQDYNYWLVDNGLGPGPYSVRVTDVYGHQVVAHRRADGAGADPEVHRPDVWRLGGRAGSGPAGHVAAYRRPGDPDRERPTVRRPCRLWTRRRWTRPGSPPRRTRPAAADPAPRSGGAGSAPVGPP